jgi:hypothetical protein
MQKAPSVGGAPRIARPAKSAALAALLRPALAGLRLLLLLLLLAALLLAALLLAALLLAALLLAALLLAALLLAALPLLAGTLVRILILVLVHERLSNGLREAMLRRSPPLADDNARPECSFLIAI